MIWLAFTFKRPDDADTREWVLIVPIKKGTKFSMEASSDLLSSNPEY